MKKLLLILFSAVLTFSSLPFSISAADAADYSKTTLSAEGFDYPQYLSDSSEATYADSEGSSASYIDITNPEGIAHLYVVFDKIYGEWTLTDIETKVSKTVGKNSFLHEYIDVASLFGSTPKSLRLSFDRSAYVTDVYGFTSGSLPEWVQIWSPPLEKADILLLSSHSDDEQLFFAGILPYYGSERKADVQVVYLISHFDTHSRPHEQLNGLWTVGIRNYPIISDFPDLYSESLDGAVDAFEAQGYTYDDFTSYIVENIRRFKPQVLITHDIEGEYGHGTHIYCTDVVINSIESIPDESFCPESAEKYGTWDVPKTYFHLYGENQITMNWDTPLESFGGKTAFEMTVEGFACHKSQHWTWFNDWIHGTEEAPVTKATDIKDYSPCNYGLYRTTVGADTVGGDFLENIVLYKNQEKPESNTEAPSAPLPESSPTDSSSDKEPVKQESTESIESTYHEKKQSTAPFFVIGASFAISVVFLLILCLISFRKSGRYK